MSAQPKIVFATFHPRPERVDDLMARLEFMLEHTRQEPGCRMYDLYRSGDDDAPVYHLLERYDDADALEAHRATDHYKAYRDGIEELLTQPIGVAVLSEVDVVGAL
jgi:quinol monooxygenase YgiN